MIIHQDIGLFVAFYFSDEVFSEVLTLFPQEIILSCTNTTFTSLISKQLKIQQLLQILVDLSFKAFDPFLKTGLLSTKGTTKRHQLLYCEKSQILSQVRTLRITNIQGTLNTLIIIHGMKQLT
ncbi:unnamed protein product [Paramecium octaurelia]|uniref:Uncharacterized protein n=1 Tax=Paramecium octaurelia TaxID=43137 RepID=A0A8S1VXF5_PAROT|nr:unnamed protein product [Paramecium octaurelia]